MDTSPEYIEMCRKAKEIQVSEPYDIYYANIYAYMRYNKIENIGTLWHGGHIYRGNPVWLPRQDQLQEILWNNFRLPCAELKLFMEYIHAITNPNYRYWHDFNSMEQLWLAFVMKEKYNKSWINGEWRIND